ncbi:hypothetical protein, partial [Aeromicrobium camelliae]|uniref:hypothetical protein n=1 Tax=Aeromicrobium camelliae TaxID=1538144 RepID=UPI001AA0570F
MTLLFESQNEGCSWTDPLCLAREGVGNVVGDVAGAVGGSIINQVAQAVAESVASLLTSLTTMWVQVDTPGLGSGGTADRIQNNVWWF